MAPGYAAALAMVVGLGPWRALEPGLEHRSDAIGAVHVEVLRVDPQRFEARVVLAQELDKQLASAREFGLMAGAVAAINGGFFDPEQRPVGLRVSGGRTVAGSLGSRLAALVRLADHRYRILFGDELRAAATAASELVQCGPRLVVGGAPNQVKRQISRRTVVGVDRQGWLVLAVTRVGRIDARELASWLARAEADGGLGLVEALNLDGGGSSQMYVSSGDEEILVAGMTPVTDAVVIYRRSAE